MALSGHKTSSVFRRYDMFRLRTCGMRRGSWIVRLIEMPRLVRFFHPLAHK
jgi:hypothetical protein